MSLRQRDLGQWVNQLLQAAGGDVYRDAVIVHRAEDGAEVAQTTYGQSFITELRFPEFAVGNDTEVVTRFTVQANSRQ